KRIGRPEAISTTQKVQECRVRGLSQSKTANALGISIPTVKRHWNKRLTERVQ
ncbi:TPA: recombinase family protein, partial [Vibrio vulnificus]